MMLCTLFYPGRWFTVSWLASIRHTPVANTWTTFLCLSNTADTGNALPWQRNRCWHKN